MEDERAPLITLVVPVYNAAPQLERFFRSVTALRAPDALCSGTHGKGAGAFEVILVDDGSTDASGQRCDGFAAQHAKDGVMSVRVVHQINGGAAAARNSGLALAKGRWVMFPDPDDALLPDYCAAAVAYGEETGAEIVCFDGWREYRGRVRGWSQYRESFVTEDRDRITEMQCRVLFRFPRIGKPDQSLAAPWDKLYRRDFLVRRRLRFPVLAVLDDMAFNFRAFGMASRVAYLHRRLYRYCYNGASITHAWRPDRPAQDRKVFLWLTHCMEAQEKRERAAVGENGKKAAFAKRQNMRRRAYVLRVYKSTLIEGKFLLGSLVACFVGFSRSAAK